VVRSQWPLSESVAGNAHIDAVMRGGEKSAACR